MLHRPPIYALWRISLGCALALAFQGSVAQALDKPRGASLGTGTGKGKTNGPLLTRAELRECLNLQTRMRGAAHELVAAQAALDKEKADLAQRKAALADELTTLDRTSAAVVDAYNASVLEHERNVDAYNGKTPAFNAKAAGLQEQRATFAKGCENRDFDEKDELAIRKGL
ncbi:MAG: hypothetical protein ABL900_09275 [Burkholderiaceae bacterium]